MAQLSKIELESLFSKIDEKLKRSVDLFVIGGASAILGYNVTKQTNDVDLDGKVDKEVQELFAEVANAQGLNIHLSEVGVFAPPDGYRARMIRHDFKNKKLRVWTLDQYDLAISKIDRGLEKDYSDILRVHKNSPYKCDRLIDLFLNEYLNVSVMGNPREKMMNLLDLIEKLFGSAQMEKSKALIGFV